MRLAVLLCGLWLAGPGQPSEHVTDLDGRRIDPLSPAEGVRATVLIFTRADCPIANRAAPEIERVRARYAARGVRFWLVFVDPAASAGRVRTYLRAFGLHAAALRDREHQLVRRAGVSITPEAAVFVHDEMPPRLAYRGRLNNQNLDLGHRRPRPTRHDLRDAVEAALEGRLPALRTTPAVGCEIADLR